MGDLVTISMNGMDMIKSTLSGYLSNNFIQSLLILFPGCLLNMYAMDTLNKRTDRPNVFNTFIQVAVGTVASYLASLIYSYSKNGVVSWIPYYGPNFSLKWPLVGFLGFASNFLTNKALDCNVPPSTMNMLKSGNLIANLIISGVFFGKENIITNGNIAGVIVITAGIYLIGAADANSISKDSSKSKDKGSDTIPKGLDSLKSKKSTSLKKKKSNSSIFQRAQGYYNDRKGYYTGPEGANLLLYYKGCTMIFVGLITQSFLSNYQSILTRQTPDVHWSSNMFYVQLFSLPYFIFVYQDISRAFRNHVAEYRKPKDVPPNSPWIKKLGILTHLSIFAVSHVFCLIGVISTMPLTRPLTLTIILSTRKFISMLISIYFSGSTVPTSFSKWIGIYACTLGTVIFFVTKDNMSSGWSWWVETISPTVPSPDGSGAESNTLGTSLDPSIVFSTPSPVKNTIFLVIFLALTTMIVIPMNGSSSH